MNKVPIAVAKVQHPTGDIVYVVPNEVCEWRVRTIFEKEPETIAWISEFNPGDVFFDVGANVGLYSVWAAKTTGAIVHAFEPEGQNFAALCQNIFLNKTDITPWPIAISNQTRIAPLNLSQFAAGASCHAVGEAISFKSKPFKPEFVQGTVCLPLDHLVEIGLPQPDFIKIDVDGLEYSVVAGGFNCLQKCRSVLIEIDSNRAEHRRAVGVFEDWGFSYDQAQVDAARRTEGPFTGIGNVIFRR